MMTNWKLKAVCAEPYRALFPLGLLGVIIGLGVWIPFFLWPSQFGYPGQSHATLQVQGFLLCFVLGFLGTMLPKVLGVAPLGPAQFLIFPIGLIALMVAALSGAGLSAQIIHLVLMINFVTFIMLRWSQRRGSLPSFFIFIAAAIAADIAGTIFRIAGLTGLASGQNFRLGALLQYQAFPLLLILGVGGFLLPKLFANEIIDPTKLKPSATGTKGLLIAAALFIVGFVFEAWWPDYPIAVQLGSGIRATVWAWFLVAQLRLHRVPAKLPTYLSGARWSLWMVGVGMLLPVAYPQYLIAFEHLIFITGILWLTLSVAARVTTAHGGQLGKLDSGRKIVSALGWLILLATVTRISTDIWTGARTFHLALASTFAIAGILIWVRLFGPLFFRFPGDGK